MALFNQFSNLPFIPFNIAMKLMENEELWKILKYKGYDCLSVKNANLTMEEKTNFIWKNQTNAQDYRVFLTDLNGDSLADGVTMLYIYERAIEPTNHIISIGSYEFDIITGGREGLIEYEGIPCSRSIVLKMFILQALNGVVVSGVGTLQFNRQLSRWCNSETTLGNNKTFNGCKFIMSTLVTDVNEVDNCD